MSSLPPPEELVGIQAALYLVVTGVAQDLVVAVAT